MRIVFAGTPDFAAVALRALIEAAPALGWTLPLVLSQPDRPAGRGMKLTASPVKQLALAHGLVVDTPQTLSLKKGGAEAQAAHQRLRAVAPDVLVVAAYGLILPQALLDVPRGLACANGARVTAINIHASLLPRWRGAAPIMRAIEAGDTRAGITIMAMDAGLDTGPMLLAESMPIATHETTGTLTARLADCGARLIVRALNEVAGLMPQLQPAAGVTYANKVDKAEAVLDFRASAVALERKIRALDPLPGATALIRGAALKVWAGRVAAAGDAPPGTIESVEATGIRIVCGEGALVITELQRPGGKRLSAREFLAGFALRPGERFDALA